MNTQVPPSQIARSRVFIPHITVYFFAPLLKNGSLTTTYAQKSMLGTDKSSYCYVHITSRCMVPAGACQDHIAGMELYACLPVLSRGNEAYVI